MKFLLAMMLLTNYCFAQIYSDDFHLDVEQSCSTGDCLFIGDSVYEMISIKDIDGFEYSKLSNKSCLESAFNFSDGDKACYTGNFDKVKEIINAMAGVTNRDYAQGGHVQIEDVLFETLSNDAMIIFTMIINHDYEAKAYKETHSIVPCL